MPDQSPDATGRPPAKPKRKSDKRQRTETLYARVTPEEKAAFIARADNAGMASAAFMRALALGDAGPRAQRRPPADHVTIRKLLGELGRVGNNINQIAHAVNCGEAPEVPELREALAAYLQLRDAIFVALGMEPTGDHQRRKPGRS